jgi:tetratricopeptide (TPR) repeat protein
VGGGPNDQAQRFYEKALDLYKKAYDFNPSYDAAYNQSATRLNLVVWKLIFRARVLYTLATSFLLPPESVSYLTTSIELYRHAVTLTESTLLQLDAGFNLSEALLELGEVIEDLHSDRAGEVRRLREEAKEILTSVMVGQEEYIASNAEDFEIDQASETVEDTPEVEQVEGTKDDAMEVDAVPDEEPAATYEEHVPTPSALVDTALLLIDTHLLLWTTLDPPSPPTEQQQLEVRSLLDRTAKIVPVGRQAEIDLAEIKVLLAMDEIVWEAFKVEAQVGTGIEKSLEGAVSALASLLSSLDTHPPDEPTLRAEILTLLAETHSTIAHRLSYLAPQLPAGPTPLGQGSWFNLSQAVTHLNQALELPTNADTPKTFKPNVLLELSKASLARAKLSSSNDTAKRNVAQLVDNAVTYGQRAAEALGWGSYVKSGTIGAPVPPYSSGWDAEWLARSVFFQIMRVEYVVAKLDLDQDLKSKYAGTVEGLVRKLKGLPAERKIKGRDLSRWLEELGEEEQGLMNEEVIWWESVAGELQK